MIFVAERIRKKAWLNISEIICRWFQCQVWWHVSMWTVMQIWRVSFVLEIGDVVSIAIIRRCVINRPFKQFKRDAIVGNPFMSISIKSKLKFIFVYLQAPASFCIIYPRWWIYITLIASLSTFFRQIDVFQIVHSYAMQKWKNVSNVISNHRHFLLCSLYTHSRGPTAATWNETLAPNVIHLFLW